MEEDDNKMKVTVTFKTPDAVHSSAMDVPQGEDRARFLEVCEKFFRYGEYADVEVDTETGEARVVPAQEE